MPIVHVSTTTVPATPAFAISRTTCLLVSMVGRDKPMTFALLAISSFDCAIIQPSEALSAVPAISWTISLHPLSEAFRAMGAPILPKPINPKRS